MNNRKYIRVYDLSEGTSQCLDVTQQLKEDLDIKSYIYEKLKVMDDLELNHYDQQIWILRKKQIFKMTIIIRKVTFKNLTNNKIEESTIEMTLFCSIYDKLIKQFEEYKINMFDKDQNQLFIYYKEQILIKDGTCCDYDIQSGSMLHYIIANKCQDQYCFYVKVNNTPANLQEKNLQVFTHAYPNQNLGIFLDKLINKYKINDQYNIYCNHQKLNLEQTLIQLGLMNGMCLHCEVPAKIYSSQSKMFIELCFKYNKFCRQIIVPLVQKINFFLEDIKREMQIENLSIIELHQNGKPILLTETLLQQDIFQENIIIIISEKVQINELNNSLNSMSQDYKFNRQEEYYPGLSILFNCCNQDCVKRSRDLIYNLRFGTFLEQNLKSKIKCENCGKDNIFCKSFQVYTCKFKISNQRETETKELRNIGLNWKEIMCAPLQQ